jgi:serine protease Do
MHRSHLTAISSLWGFSEEGKSRAFSYRLSVSLSTICLAVAIALSSLGPVRLIGQEADSPSSAGSLDRSPSASELSRAFRLAAERALPSVVTVYARKIDEKEKKLELDLEDVLGEDVLNSDNIGSGVILSDQGLVVTNHHVVEDCNRVRVNLPDGRSYFATNIRSDPASDLAVLSITSPKKFTSLKIGDSNRLAVGDWVLAIGSPFAIEQTVSAGIISGKGRAMKGIVAGQLIQTDAVINPGNSGGALVNLDGELVGINTVIASTSGEFQGVGFAIPSNRVQWISSELNSYGTVRRATMGVTTIPVPAEIAEQLDLAIPAGAIVIRIREGLPAEKAGLKKGDVIIKLADQNVKSPLDLNTIVEQLPFGQPFVLRVLREGEPVELTVTLQEKESVSKTK